MGPVGSSQDGGRPMSSTVSRRRWLMGAAAMAGTTLGACNAGETGGGPVGKSHAPVTITIWHHPLFPWRADVGKEITDPLLAANPWLTLESTELIGGGGNAGREKVLAAPAAGAPPDSFTSGYTDTQDFMDGVVLNLEKYLKTTQDRQEERHLGGAAPGLRVQGQPGGHALRPGHAPACSCTRRRRNGRASTRTSRRRSGRSSRRRRARRFAATAGRCSTWAGRPSGAAAASTPGWCPTGSWAVSCSTPTRPR